jgi:hypothetical protein
MHLILPKHFRILWLSVKRKKVLIQKGDYDEEERQFVYECAIMISFIDKHRVQSQDL